MNNKIKMNDVSYTKELQDALFDFFEMVEKKLTELEKRLEALEKKR